jgi:hypothetical protein
MCSPVVKVQFYVTDAEQRSMILKHATPNDALQSFSDSIICHMPEENYDCLVKTLKCVAKALSPASTSFAISSFFC